MNETYKVAVLTGERKIEVIEKELVQPRGNQVLVKVAYCAICTLEQRIYSGAMKRYPFAGGHEAAGTLAAVGEEVGNLKVGDKVSARMLTTCGECYFCRSGRENQCVVSFQADIHEGVAGPGGLAEYMLLDAKSVYKMADDLDLGVAALTEPLACCVHSVNNAGIELGSDVVVVGSGIMGNFHIQLAKRRGARVIACEVDEKRLQVAKQSGADILINPKETNAIKKVRELTEGRGADVVFCTAAIAQLAADSIQMTARTGRVILYSSFGGGDPIGLDVDHVHSSEINITGAVNQNVRDFFTATRLINHRIIDPANYIAEVVPLENIDYAFERAIDPKTFRVLVEF